MARWKATIAYDGSGFSGWQEQPGKRTVQGELEKGLTKLHKGENKKVFASGRTDADVHARGQVVHFDSSLQIPSARWPRAFDSVLPRDMQMVSVEHVNDHFHARYDAEAKEYRYLLHVGSTRDLFQRHYVHHVFAHAFDHEAVQRSLQPLVGTHDFSAFCANNTNVASKVRTLNAVSYMQVGEGEWCFRFNGNGFLYNMARIIVGTAIDIGMRRLDAEDMNRILHARDRRQAGMTAPGRGLYLWNVQYGP
ncbi:tRNA pseudouridine(38-40) synthase TruA [Salicibibacter halophilus]|uniref:tRNA pseudouridine synthase A n=1 Tax=Salicibibacter halophilus TaxID=2502791 RepID=A0A514LIW6_9BACI|nr:tRNA pseudouridine(38-40) synthase TruA [Salicibibacter halophilus]QDI91475.1 tRNA pseudouridine(38-40) synthase TruA [Salicibibacter halophilus]